MSTSKNNANANNTSEVDIIFNRANVALARSQRLVASWLPPKTDEELANSNKTEEELQREEDELFKPVPEKYALAFPPWTPSKKKFATCCVGPLLMYILS